MENVEFAKKKKGTRQTRKLNNIALLSQGYFLTMAGKNRSSPLPFLVFQHFSRYRCNATDATFFHLENASCVTLSRMVDLDKVSPSQGTSVSRTFLERDPYVRLFIRHLEDGIFPSIAFDRPLCMHTDARLLSKNHEE